MPISHQEIETLLQWVRLTRNEEIDCDLCFSQIAEFAERELAQKPLNESLAAVAQHLAICGDCQEEYEALLQGLERLSD